MYITMRGGPKDEPAAELQEKETGAPPVMSDDHLGARGARIRGRVPRTVLALGLVSLLTDVSSESVSAVLPLYITAVMGMGPLAYGFVDGIYQGVSAAVRLLGGWWADQSRRPKWVAFVGYLVSAVSKIGLIAFAGFGALSAAIAVDRLGKGLRTGPRDALIVASSDPRRLGRNFGVHRSLDTAGALVGPLIAFAVLASIPIGSGGYHAVFVISLCFAIVGVAALALIVPDLRSRSAGRPTGPRQPAARRVTVRAQDLLRPGLRRVLIAAAVLGVGTIGDGFIYLTLADGDALATRYFPLLFVGTNAAYLALAIPLGRLADRVGRGKVFIAGHMLLLAVYLLIAARLLGAAGAVLVLVLLGSFYAATDGVLSALTARVVPAQRQASGIAAAQTVVAIARFGSSIGFGLLWQLTARTTAAALMAVVLTVAVVVAAVALRPLLARPAESDSAEAVLAGAV